MASYLADKSALSRMPNESVGARLAPLIEAGEVASCGIVDLEVLYSARSAEDFDSVRVERLLAFEQVAIEQADFDRAVDVMGALARRGQHRAASIPDLLIAAVGERSGLTVLHYDGDFDLIAEVTKQSTEWVAPRGTIS